MFRNAHHYLNKVLLMCLFFISPNLISADYDDETLSFETYKTTYEKFLIDALKGDAKAQNFIGYMHFYGEGTEQDYQQAHHWFHLAAASGDIKAMRNLGLFHARALERVPEKYFNPEESNLWLAKSGRGKQATKQSSRRKKHKSKVKFSADGPAKEVGKKVYQTFCGGCHGYDGIATFQLSPSFAKGERLKKGDKELLSSILHGKNIMPAWEEQISVEQGKNVLLYIRSEFGGNKKVKISAAKQKKAKAKGPSLGAKTYARYCAGCHGFSGIAYYVNSPSFALGEQLNKSDAVLNRSIRFGKNIMPGWGDMLSREQINSLVKYIRTLAKDFDVGIARELNSPSDFYYTFKPRA